jgi:hypothetical protein
MFDVDQLGLIGSRTLDEVHFLKHELTVGNDLFHLALLRWKLLLGSMASLFVSPFHFPLDLVPLRRIRGITWAANTCEFGRTHISDDTGAADYFRQRADLAGRLLERTPNLFRVSEGLCAYINPIDEDQFRSS